MIRAAVALLVCLAGLFATGCGKSHLDTSKLEGQIQTELAKRTGVGIEKVDCPGSVEARKGDRFTCTATTARKERVVVQVTQDNSEGAVTWRVRPSGR